MCGPSRHAGYRGIPKHVQRRTARRVGWGGGEVIATRMSGGISVFVTRTVRFTLSERVGGGGNPACRRRNDYSHRLLERGDLRARHMSTHVLGGAGRAGEA